MKTIIMMPHLGKGGAEDIIVNLSNNLSSDHKNNITLLLLQHLSEDAYNISRLKTEVEIKYLFKKELSSVSKITKLHRLSIYLFSPLVALYVYFKFKMKRYDNVHINLTGPRLLAPWLVLLKKLTRSKELKIVETFHSNWHLLSKLQKIICVLSWSTVDQVICEIGYEEVKNVQRNSKARDVVFIPFGVEKPEDRDDLFLNNFTKQHNFRKKSVVIMTIARLVNDIKRFDVILNALAIVKQKGYSNFEYIICGDGKDRSKILKWIEELNLTDEVSLLGFIDRPQQVVQLADIFVVAMVDDFTGIAGLQACLSEIPVIGIQTVANFDGENAVIWSSDDAEVLASKVIELMDSKVASEYSNKIMKHVEITHNIEKFYCEYRKIFGVS